MIKECGYIYFIWGVLEVWLHARQDVRRVFCAQWCMCVCVHVLLLGTCVCACVWEVHACSSV